MTEPTNDTKELVAKLREAFEQSRYGGDGAYNPDADLFDAAADALAHPTPNPAPQAVAAEGEVFVVSLLLSKREPDRTITSMTQSWKAGGTREEAIGKAILFAQEAKPGFSIGETLVTVIDTRPTATNGDKDAVIAGSHAFARTVEALQNAKDREAALREALENIKRRLQPHPDDNAEDDKRDKRIAHGVACSALANHGEAV